MQTFDWVDVKSESDGWHAINTPSGLSLENVVTQQRKVIVEAGKAPPLGQTSQLNVDQSKILWGANTTKGYRYSFFANYLVQDVATGAVQPLDPEQKADIQYAVWSPRYINLVCAHPLYIFRG